MTDLKQVVAEVKRAYDIVDYVAASGVALRPSGTSSKGLCPFHEERTPSFTVDSGWQTFRCFGCGEHGDLVSYVQKKESLSFVEALEKLADAKGIEVSLGPREEGVDYRALRACVSDAAIFFRSQFRSLPDDHKAVQEVTGRGLSRSGMVYGYAPQGNALLKHLRAKGHSDGVIEQAGVCRRGEHGLFDLWRGRLMFFVTDTAGRPAGFSGRRLFDTDKMGKYVNSPDTPLFNKSRLLYSSARARKPAAHDGTIFVVEGQFDVAAMVQAGLPATVAALGTAFTQEHALACSRMVGDNGKVVFCFDGDKAGLAAAVKVFRSVPAIHSKAHVVVLPDGTDPCEVLQQRGPQALKDLVETSQAPMSEFVLDQAAAQVSLSSSQGRAVFLSQAAEILASVSSYPLREALVSKVALAAFVPADTVREAAAQAARRTEGRVPVPPVPQGRKEADAAREYGPSPVDEAALVARIDAGGVYGAAARMAALCVRYPRLVPSFLRLTGKLPEDMRWMAEDLERLAGRERVLPEDFTCSQVMAHVMTADLFPYLGLMPPRQMVDLYRQLGVQVSQGHDREERMSRQASTVQVLAASPLDTALLRKAVERDASVGAL